MAKRKRDSDMALPKQKRSKTKLVPAQILDKINLTHSFNKVLYHVRWPNSWEPSENVYLPSTNSFETTIEMAANENCLLETSVNDEIWDIHKIIDKRTSNDKMEYFVKWKDSWMWSDELNCPHLIRKFDYANANNNNNETKTQTTTEKRKRLNVTRRIVKTSDSNESKKEEKQSPSKIDHEIIIKDKQIKRIVKIGVYFGVTMFCFQRLTGEEALIPTKIANIKYPNAVMDFYEEHLELQDLD